MEIFLFLFMLFAFPISFFLSLLAILLALLRHRNQAKNAAIVSIVLTLCPSLILVLGLDPDFLPIVGCFFFVIFLFGMIALMLNQVYSELEPVKGSQIPLSVIFFLITVLGCGLGIYKIVQNLYYHERDQLFAEYKTITGINDIRVIGHDNDDAFWIDEVTFSVEGIPNSIVRISYESWHPSFKDSKLKVKQIGPWEFQQDITAIYKNHLSEHLTLSSERSFSTNYLSFGKEGHANQFPDRIGAQIHAIEDIRDNYLELVSEFKKWPTKSNPGTFSVNEHEQDSHYEYYCLQRPTNDFLIEDQPKATDKQPPSD